MSAISVSVSQLAATFSTDSTLGTASTESQFALKELRVEWGLSCFSSRYWPAVLSATGSLVSQCLGSRDASQCSVRTSELRAGAKILNGDYHLALNNKCGKTVNKSHRKAAAAVRLTTAKTFTASFRSFAVFSREIWEWTTYWRSYNKLKSYTSNKLRSYLQQLNN